MKVVFSLIYLSIFVVFSSICTATTYEFTNDNSIELLKDSTKAAQIKINLIKNAKSSIHIMSYFLDNSEFPSTVIEELVKAHKRGVEVRIIASYIPTRTKDLFLKTVKNLKVNEGAVFAYLLMHSTDNLIMINNIHEKLLLVDGQISVMGGRNLSDSSFKAKDIEAMVSGGITLQLQEHFLKMLNAVIGLEKIRKLKNNLDKISFNLNDSKYFPAPIKTGSNRGRLISHDAILRQIEKKMNHNERIRMDDEIVDAIIATDFSTMRAYNYYILPTDKYLKFLYEKYNSGREIKIITNSLKTAGIVSNKGYIYALPMTHNLVNSGIEIYQWQGPKDLDYLHEKVIIFDNNHVFLGSHNFGIGSTSVSNEITIEFFSEKIGEELVGIFDEEIANLDKTFKATNLSTAREINENLKMINFLKGSVIGDLLEETY